MRKSTSGLLIAVMACITGCGKQERNEAVQLAKVLSAKRADYASSDAIERDFVNSARAWCAGITTNGAGRGVELAQNAAVATVLAKSAVAVSAQLSQVRQVVDDQPLKEQYPRDVRNALITQLTKRQRLLQDMRALLEQAAPQFVARKWSSVPIRVWSVAAQNRKVGNDPEAFTSVEAARTSSPYFSTRSLRPLGLRAVATRRSPDASTASAMLRPNPLALPVTNQTLDTKILHCAS